MLSKIKELKRENESIIKERVWEKQKIKSENKLRRAHEDIRIQVKVIFLRQKCLDACV